MALFDVVEFVADWLGSTFNLLERWRFCLTVLGAALICAYTHSQMGDSGQADAVVTVLMVLSVIIGVWWEVAAARAKR